MENVLGDSIKICIDCLDLRIGELIGCVYEIFKVLHTLHHNVAKALIALLVCFGNLTLYLLM